MIICQTENNETFINKTTSISSQFIHVNFQLSFKHDNVRDPHVLPVCRLNLQFFNSINSQTGGCIIMTVISNVIGQ